MTARRFTLVNEDGTTCSGLDEAKAALDILKENRRKNALPTPGLKPGFNDWTEQYFQTETFRNKRPATSAKDTAALIRWRTHPGNVSSASRLV